jgi:exodeoxyribonuclease-5
VGAGSHPVAVVLIHQHQNDAVASGCTMMATKETARWRSAAPMLSKEQQRAIETLDARLDTHRLAQCRGPAGTGKTTLAVEFANRLGAIALTFTGKAAAVLRRKGARRVETIHSYVYGAPEVAELADGGTALHWHPREHPKPASLIAVDETCQIDPALGRHLLSLDGQIVTFGDSIQLPPIDGRPAFSDRFPVDVELTKIHRQSAQSSVLRLATQIREGGPLPKGEDFCLDDLLGADVVLCALNGTRQRFNFGIRRRRFSVRYKHTLPIAGERLIALRNDHRLKIWNGTLWQVQRVVNRGDLLALDLFDEDEGHRAVQAPIVCFTEPHSVNVHTLPSYLTPLDFGYAITVHKAQGSEWQRVAVINETTDPRFKYIAGNMPIGEFRRRWLYVAVTRAEEKVDVARF